MILPTRLRKRKDHYVITVYKTERTTHNICIGDLLVIVLAGEEIVRPVRKDFHVSLPKRLIDKTSQKSPFILDIIHTVKKEEALVRPSIPFADNMIDIRHCIPTITHHGYPCFIINRGDGVSSIWYAIGGGVDHFTINNLIDVEKLGELLGFYFGNGSTSPDITSLRLTNAEPSVLDYCLKVLEVMGISRDRFKIQVIYSTPAEVNEDIQERCILFWSDALGIPVGNIISVLKANNIRETKRNGSARLFIDSAVLVEVFLHSLLPFVMQRAGHPTCEQDEILLRSFIRGLLAAEGYPEFNTSGTLTKISIAYDPFSDEPKIYRALLQNLGVHVGKDGGNAVHIYGRENLKCFVNMDCFKMHATRKAKLLRGVKAF